MHPNIFRVCSIIYEWYKFGWNKFKGFLPKRKMSFSEGDNWLCDSTCFGFKVMLVRRILQHFLVLGLCLSFVLNFQLFISWPGHWWVKATYFKGVWCLLMFQFYFSSLIYFLKKYGPYSIAHKNSVFLYGSFWLISLTSVDNFW